MTPRERYIAALTFGTPDKIPLEPGWPRESTLARWVQEGLPAELGQDPDAALRYVEEDLLGIRLDPAEESCGFFADYRMKPTFEERVLEHTNGHYIVLDWMGAVTEISDRYDYTYIRTAKDFVTRKWHSFPVKTREDWEKMKFRYDPYAGGRLPEDLEAVAQKAALRTQPLSIALNGPFWQLREWMGMENLCLAFVDEPALVQEMIDFWCDFVIRLSKRFLPYVVPDRVLLNEDMAYKAHPMIGPAMTRKFIGPTYRKWAEMFHAAGVPCVCMDSDGYIEDLIPVWRDAGISVVEPIEVAAGNDIVHFREKFGTEVAYCGGIDKRAIAAGGESMRAEVTRVVPPLLKQGGFIPRCDHGVPHDISLPNFTEYVRLLAQLTGWL